MTQRQPSEGADGDLADFSAFVAARSSALLRTACFLASGDRHAGEDLLQEAFVESFRRWHRIRQQGAREAYVRRILVRRASRRWRTSRFRLISPNTNGPNNIANHEEAYPSGTSDQAVDLKRLLKILTPRQRTVIVLKYYEDLSDPSIAELLGCSVGTVKTHNHRALEHLAREMPANYRPANTVTTE